MKKQRDSRQNIEWKDLINSLRSGCTFFVRLFDNIEFDNKSVSVGSSDMDAVTHTFNL